MANGGGGEGEAKGVEGNEVFAADEGPFADAMYHLVSISADASLYVLPANSFDSSAHMVSGRPRGGGGGVIGWRGGGWGVWYQHEVHKILQARVTCVCCYRMFLAVYNRIRLM